MALPGTMRFSIRRASTAKQCSRSAVVRVRCTTSPFRIVITFGLKPSFDACTATRPWGASPAPIAKAAAVRMPAKAPLPRAGVIPRMVAPALVSPAVVSPTFSAAVVSMPVTSTFVAAASSALGWRSPRPPFAFGQ